MAEINDKASQKNPLAWVPTLYFTQGFPYTTVMEMATVFFKTLNVPIEALGIFQGFFGLPWAFKFIWSPLVELAGTKRRWILIMQTLLAATFIGLAAFVFLPANNSTRSLSLFMPNIMNNWANAGFTVGIILLMFCIGFGLDKRRSAGTRALCAIIGIGVISAFGLYHSTVFMHETLTLSTTIWILFLFFLLTAFFSATQDIAIDGYYLDVLDPAGQAKYSGARVMFYRIAMVVGGGFLVMLAGGGGKSIVWHSMTLPGYLTGWPAAFTLGAALFVLFLIFHYFYLPKHIVPTAQANTGLWKKSFGDAFSTYLDQNRIVIILLFIFLFRIGDYLWKPMSKLFLLDIGVSVGQLGFLQGVIGIIATILGSILGGIYISKRGLTRGLWVLGIIQSVTLLLYAWLALVHKVGPKGTDGLVLNSISSTGLWHVGVINTFENFAYGLGTIAFVNFLMRTCKKEYYAAHYAIATGIMALATMLASLFSGFLAKEMGYMTFFILCFATSIPGLLLLFFLPLKNMEIAKS
jgi:MFS transporter, PAT family, beta-lactamase induction signal transducer AmpG